jgi:hypothetical protein
MEGLLVREKARKMLALEEVNIKNIDHLEINPNKLEN